MAINNLPAALQPAIQTNYLAHMFEESLTSNFKFRSAATRMTFPNGVGETITKTRPGLLAPVSATIMGSQNTNLDNGLTPAYYATEQYTATLNLLASTLDLNVKTSKVAIVDVFVENAKKLAQQAAQSMDRQAQAQLYAAGMYGNTRVTQTTTTTTIKLDDIRGFQNVWVNGQLTPVSGTNTLSITLNGNPYTVTAATPDGSNVSSVAAFGGISGTVTTTAAAATGDAAVTSGVGTAALAAAATTVLRPNHTTGGYWDNTSRLIAGDVLTLAACLDATAQLRSNAVDGFEGDAYVIFLSPTSMRQIFKDPDFKQLYQGDAEKSAVFPNATIYRLAGLIFVSTTDVATQTLNGVKVQRPIIVGEGALIEMIAEALYAEPEGMDGDVVYNFDGVQFVNREPIDRLKSIVAQSWMSIFAYVCPTDTSVLASVIPTASNSAYKRVVLIEHASV